MSAVPATSCFTALVFLLFSRKQITARLKFGQYLCSFCVATAVRSMCWKAEHRDLQAENEEKLQ